MRLLKLIISLLLETFATGGRLEDAPLPGLSVKGVGSIGLPLSDAQAKQIIEKGTQESHQNLFLKSRASTRACRGRGSKIPNFLQAYLIEAPHYSHSLSYDHILLK